MEIGLPDLVRAARRGDRHAFAELVARERDRLVKVARGILLDFHEAEDAAQEAFVAAHRHLAGLRDPERFRGWLTRILVRIATRRRRRRPAPSGEALERVPAGESDRPEELEALLREFRALPRKYRDLLSLHYLGGLSYAEVAEASGLTVKRVKSRLFDARALLRRRLGDG